jgi:hypothetical protein
MRIFKYRGGNSEVFERDLYSLENNYFWAPTRENLNDPCEGLYGRDYLDSQLQLVKKIFNTKKNEVSGSLDDINKSLKAVLNFTDTSGIYSLSTDIFDELLWAYYGYSHKGFCIEYSMDKLIDFTKIENYKIPVIYQNKPPELNVTDIIGSGSTRILQKILGTKSKKWKYEKEIRIVTSISGKHHYDYRAVKAIYFGLRMDENQQTEIMKRLACRDIEYYKIVLKDGYKFDKKLVKDMFAECKKYKYSIGTIADYAITPDLVNEKYTPLIPYLYKAGEIVRREPYCDFIEMVEFSTTKSTPENPIIFVQYKRAENKWVNHYLTILEIDQQYSQLTDL